jgi:serine/threonine protein kinase
MNSDVQLIAGRYQVLSTEFEGGLSRVRKALDTKTEELVAIKYIENTPDPLITQDIWEQEVRALKILKSESVVRFIDKGFDRNANQYFIVLEWLRESLAARLTRISKIGSLRDWGKLSSRLLAAVAHIHSKNVFHRDIKPDNIMFRSTDDDDFEVVLIDFGIAKDSQSSPHRTLGDFRTPVFSPPNPALHDNFQRDIYAVAMVLLQALESKRFSDRHDAVVVLEKFLAMEKFPKAVLKVLERALGLSQGASYSSVVELRQDYLRAIAPHVRVNTKQIILSLVLTDTPKKFLSEQGINQRDFGNFFYGLFENDVYFANGSNEVDESNILLFAGNYQLKLAVPSDGDRSYLVVRTMRMLDDIDYLNRKIHKALDLNKFIAPVVVNDGRGSSDLDSVDSLLNFLSQKIDDESESYLEPEDRFYIWKNVLQAREEFILNRYKTIQFTNSKSYGRTFEVDASLDENSPAVESCWEIDGLRGFYFLYEGNFGDKYSFRSTKSLPDMPKNGKLVPSLGFDRPSLNKQKAALDDILSGTSVNPDLAEHIRNPRMIPASSQAKDLVFNVELIDDEKRAAINGALSCQGFFVVEGPPGTGKTSFIAELIRQFSIENPQGRTLLVSQTHVAVDNALERLEKSGFDSLVRVGRQAQEKVSSKTVHMLIENRTKQWSAVAENASNQYLETLARDSGFDPIDLRRARALREFIEVLETRDPQPIEENHFELKTIYDLQNQLISDKIPSEATSRSTSKELIQKLKGLGYGSSFVGSLTKEKAESEIAAIKAKGDQLGNLVGLATIQADWVMKFPWDSDLKSRFIKNSKVIAGTCIGFLGLSDVAELEFDLCIIDEVSKATATEALVPISRALKTVLVGDSNQLPPSEEDLLSESEILGKFELSKDDVEETLFDVMKQFLPKSNKAMLRKQYRMVPEIGDLISECFYDGLLESVRDQSNNSYVERIGKPVRWLSTSSSEGRREIPNGFSYENRFEAREAIRHLEEINSWATGRTDIDPGRKLEVLVITPYLAQKRAITERLAQVTCDAISVRVETFDAVQGVESDFSIVSLVRSNPDNRFGFIGPKYWRRLNVALSRAKFGVSIIGDLDFCEGRPSRLLDVIHFMKMHPNACEVRAV